MVKEEVIIQNAIGLHARPASILVKEASKFTSEITVIKDNKEYNAKSILSVLSMGASKGDLITIKAVGLDEVLAINTLTSLVSNLKD